MTGDVVLPRGGQGIGGGQTHVVQVAVRRGAGHDGQDRDDGEEEGASHVCGWRVVVAVVVVAEGWWRISEKLGGAKRWWELQHIFFSGMGHQHSHH